MPRGHGAPLQVDPTSLDVYLEVMSKPVFQAGISWAVVEKKWPGIRAAFHDFNTGAVAGMSDSELARLLQDERVIRSDRKIAAVRYNARKMIDLDSMHGTFKSYLGSHAGFEATLKSLRKEFKFLGDMGAYHFLYVVREPVPAYEEFCREYAIRAMPI